MQEPFIFYFFSKSCQSSPGFSFLSFFFSLQFISSPPPLFAFRDSARIFRRCALPRGAARAAFLCLPRAGNVLGARAAPGPSRAGGSRRGGGGVGSEQRSIRSVGSGD